MIDPIRLCTFHGEFHARDLNAVMGQQPWDLVHFTYASTGTRRPRRTAVRHYRIARPVLLSERRRRADGVGSALAKPLAAR